MANPAIVAEAHRQSLAILRSEILPMAVKRHMAILSDPKVTGQSLNKAIEMAYKYGGVMADPDGQVKDAAEMTPEELGKAIAALERAAKDASRPTIDLEVEPVAEACVRLNSNSCKKCLSCPFAPKVRPTACKKSLGGPSLAATVASA